MLEKRLPLLGGNLGSCERDRQREALTAAGGLVLPREPGSNHTLQDHATLDIPLPNLALLANHLEASLLSDLARILVSGNIEQ